MFSGGVMGMDNVVVVGWYHSVRVGLVVLEVLEVVVVLEVCCGG